MLLRFLEGAAPPRARGKDIQVETTLGALLGALAGDLELRRDVSDVSRLPNRSLLWLHEQEILVLGNGLTIFRPAITIHLEPGPRQFTGSVNTRARRSVWLLGAVLVDFRSKGTGEPGWTVWPAAPPP
jgi:hypothetical protein